jgi:hypothetical protein
MRAFIGGLLFLVSAGSACAANLSAADQASLAGEWRNGCSDGDMTVTMEFAVTGGVIWLDDGSEGADSYPIVSADMSKDRLRFTLKDGGKIVFFRRSDGKMTGEESSGLQFEGRTFQHCQKSADRAAIRLSRAEIAQISAAMPPDNPILVDDRARAGCTALDYQYLTIDLVGPLGFSMGRWNSADLAEKETENKNVHLARDEAANWEIEKAESTPSGTKLTITELIPPNGSRGDTTTITLSRRANGRIEIPEWKRSFIRCTDDQLTAH